MSDGTANGEKNITKYFYSNGGIQTKMETGLNSANDSDYMTTNYAYDAWGHLVNTTDSTGYNSGTTTYDLNGNVLTVTDANGNITTNTYDALNRVLTVNTVCDDSSKNVSKSYTYNNMGWMTNKSSNGTETSIEYDALGRVTKEWGPNFKGYFYEGVSNYVEKQLVGYAHLLLYSVTNYEYDAEMRIVKVLESGSETASYTYDANGNKTSETQANGVVSTYTYNSANKITNLITKSGNSTISEYEYSYYLDGSDACKVRKESGIIETRSYEYDGLKRLTEEAVTTGSSTDTYAYEYDDYGNRSKMTATGSESYVTDYSYSDSNGNYTALLQKETKTVDGTSEEIVANGLATSPADLLTTDNSDVKQTVYTYDANGNQITKTADGKTETNTYDGLNQLIGFTDGETTASYTYDVDGLRLSKTVDGKTTKHVWDGNQQLVADVLDSELYSANCYLRGTNLVATYSYQNGEKSGYTYYTQNAHGDVVNLTDATGAISKSYTYDAFGVEKNIDDSDTNAFRYCGEYYDSESGTIYLRARYYNPTTGRFISRDSYAGKNSDPLSLNLYTYCYNNPLIYIDPSGHLSLKDISSFINKVKKSILIKNDSFHSNFTHSEDGAIELDDSGSVSYEAIFYSKKRTARRDSGLADYSDEEISKKARDKSLSPKERKRFITEEKIRGYRNKQKRQSNIQMPDPYGTENYTSIDFASDRSNNRHIVEGTILIAGSAVALTWLVVNDTTGVGVADDMLIPETLYGIGKGISLVTG